MTPAPPSDWPRAIALATLTALAVYTCYLITVPFLPGLSWAVALAVVTLPVHRRLKRALGSDNWAAGLTTALVVLVIGVPIALMAYRLTQEVMAAAQLVQKAAADDGWRPYAAKVPYFGEPLSQLRPEEIEGQLRTLAQQFGGHTFGVAGGVGAAIVQILVAAFVLFFCFRDRHHLLNEVRRLIPLNTATADKIIDRAVDAVYATLYGTILAGVIQGVTGGLLFWAVGLPGAIVWGVIMFLLGILPFLGAFLVWVPAAAYLATHDQWGEAVALVVWGLVMAGPVSNYVYAYFAGDRMKIHPVPALIAFIGGLAVFGVSGIVLGPCVLVVTVALLDVWRHRSIDGTSLADSTRVLTPSGAPT
ncbi:AI-2E family transporter [Limnoglobus roseus]|uniref:AI-2E family transporter n=1 Tax=Limnoglobus roseus TaxID=2598579 RepID=A0A5C1AAG5_9BACT|nr:AI-2E family transporter [Limnoglobus roseus]QEL15016.1 AI-2E family transporter [Limnoglobus roseus]